MKSELLDHPLVTERYFFPRYSHLENPFWVDVSGEKLGCYYTRPFPEAPTIVFFSWQWRSGLLITRENASVSLSQP